jgi:Polysaccharide lyase
MKLKPLFLITILTTGVAAHGTVVFQNDGTTSGWSYTSHDGSGSVTQVSSPTYKGSTALKHYQTWSGSGDYTLHSEAVIRDVGKNGWNRYYGWALYLPSNWSYNTSRGQAVSQLAADTSCGGQQTDMFQMLSTHLEVKRELLDPCNPTRSTLTVVDPVSAGVWHRIVIHKLWASDNTGVYQVWFDGSKKIDKSNQPNSHYGSYLYRWSIGLYANFSSAGSRTLYTDHARCTSSYNEADPAQW